jgi:hypothetical protein
VVGAKISVVSTEAPLDFARGKLRPERRPCFNDKQLIGDSKVSPRGTEFTPSEVEGGLGRDDGNWHMRWTCTWQERHHGQSRRRFGDAERCVHAGNDATPGAATGKRLPHYRKYRKFQGVAQTENRRRKGRKGRKPPATIRGPRFINDIKDLSISRRALPARRGSAQTGGNRRKPRLQCTAWPRSASGCPS